MTAVKNAEQTIDGLLRRGADLWPDRNLVLLEDGTAWTWAQCLSEASRAANVFARQGITRGDHIMVLLPNGPAWLRAWWGAALLGARFVPVNPAYKGQLLTDVCETIAPTAIVAGSEIAERLTAPHRSAAIDPATLVDADPWFAEPSSPTQPSEPHCLLMTSGTTGPSKASVTTHAYVCHLAAWLVDHAGLDEDDVFMADMPWFHLSSLAPAVQMLRVGGKIAVRSAPAMRDYWRTAKDLGATFAVAPGTVAQFLSAQPPCETDRDHAMRFLLSSPLPADLDTFIQRFGLEGVCTAYGSTEANLCVCAGLDIAQRAGSCGKIRPGFQVRLVDADDYEVAPGEVGEAIVRTDQPWLQSQGYLGMPEATLTAWRNGWFHTGDALRKDEDGYYFFHDRYKDGLRRRGENISSYEVEREIVRFAGVEEVACVAHPSDYGADDEVKVFLVTSNDALSLDFPQLLEFLVERLPYFMVPRYFEVIDELPKTPTQRVQKHLLRERGNGPSTWDRESSGFLVKREGLVRREI